MGEIKTKLTLEGEKEYKQKLSDASRQLKLLGTEIKSETKVFDSNGKAVTNWNKKAALLRKEVEQQKTIVKAMEERLEKLKDKYGENSSQVQNFEAKLNNARSALNNLNGQLSEAQSSSVNWQNALVGASDAAGTALLGLGATAGTVFAGIVASAKQAVTSIDQIESETADRADDLLTTSQQTGISTDDLQAWEYEGRIVDTSADTIAKSIKKLRSTMTDKNKQMDIATILGVDVRDKNGLYKDAQSLFFEMTQAISDGIKSGKINPYGTEFGNLLQDAFGKGYDELQPLFQNYDQWKQLIDEFNGNGLGMNADTLNKFGALDDLQEKWDALKQSITETVASFFVDDWTTLYTDLDKVASAFNQFLKGEDGSEQSLGDALKQLFSDLGDSINKAKDAYNEVVDSLQKSDSPELQAVGNFFAGIRDSFKWIVDNQNSIKTALETILGVFIAGKTVAAMNKLSDLLLKIKLLGGGGTAATAETAAANTAGEAVTAGASGSGTVGSLVGLSGLFNLGALAAIPAIQTGLENLGNYLTERSTAYRENAVTENEGRWQVADPEAARAAAQAFADAYAQKGAYMSGSEFTELTGAIEDAVGDADIASEIVGEITDATTVGEAWTVPDTWFSSIQTGVENSVTQGINDACAKSYSANVTVSESGTGTGNTAGSGFWSKFSSFFGGSHASGLLDVPYDGYTAVLHKGETVLTASQGARWRTGQGGSSAITAKQINQLISGITGAMSGMAVNMDGRTVGTLVAPAVSEAIARGLAY